MHQKRVAEGQRIREEAKALAKERRNVDPASFWARPANAPFYSEFQETMKEIQEHKAILAEQRKRISNIIKALDIQNGESVSLPDVHAKLHRHLPSTCSYDKKKVTQGLQMYWGLRHKSGMETAKREAKQFIDFYDESVKHLDLEGKWITEVKTTKDRKEEKEEKEKKFRGLGNSILDDWLIPDDIEQRDEREIEEAKKKQKQPKKPKASCFEKFFKSVAREQARRESSEDKSGEMSEVSGSGPELETERGSRESTPSAGLAEIKVKSEDFGADAKLLASLTAGFGGTGGNPSSQIRQQKPQGGVEGITMGMRDQTIFPPMPSTAAQHGSVPSFPSAPPTFNLGNGGGSAPWISSTRDVAMRS